MAGRVTLDSQRVSRRFFARFDRNQTRSRLGEVLDYQFFWYALGGRVNL